MNRRTTFALLVLTAPVGTAAAQLLPPQRTYDIVVSDSTNDIVARLLDVSQNGTYSTPGEFIAFYDAANSDGAPAVTNTSSLVYDRRGNLFLADTGLDLVVRATDTDGDGQARLSTLGEWSVYFDGSNAAGVAFPSILTIVIDENDVLWGVNSGAGAAPLDFVFRAQDLNFDGDAQDAGEITIVYDSTAGSVNIATPFGLAIDPQTGDLLVTDVNPDGIYRLRDLDLNGDFYGAGEVTAVYTGTDPTAPGLLNANRIRFAPDGALLVNDATLDMILRLVDGNANGSYDDANEAKIFADPSGNGFGVPANQFDIQVDENGVVFACENSALDGIIRYQDLNVDGDANDAGETTVIYDNVLGPGALPLPRALALVPAPRLLAPLGTTATIGGTLSLSIAGFANDSYLMLLGVVPLGGAMKVPPFGTLSFIPFPLVLASGTLDANGAETLNFPIPGGGVVPVGAQVYFTTAVGKAPFRTYLSNELLITFQ